MKQMLSGTSIPGLITRCVAILILALFCITPMGSDFLLEVITLGQIQTPTFDSHRAIAKALETKPNLTIEEAAAAVNSLQEDTSSWYFVRTIAVLMLLAYMLYAFVMYWRARKSEVRSAENTESC